jgi:hypothetical protein
MYRQWSLYVPPVVTICTASLTFNNSTFCPQSVFICFVWITEQTAIISLYSANWLVCITERESVYCEVRTGCLYITEVKLCTLRILSQFRRLIASLSPRWPRFDSRPAHMRFEVELWHWTDLSPSASVSLRHTIPPRAPNSSSATSGSHRKEKGAEPGDLPKMLFRKWRNTKGPALPTDLILFICSIQRLFCLVTAKCILCGAKIQFYIYFWFTLVFNDVIHCSKNSNKW